MYNDQLVIDVHGHMSSPPAFRAYAYSLIGSRTPRGTGLDLADDDMEPALQRHIRVLDERDIDVQLISPRPVAMMHWEDAGLTEHWTRTTNDVIAQQCRMRPGRLFGVAQLPQNKTVSTENCLQELDRCVHNLGFVGALVNPDPGSDGTTPGMDTDYWFPLYERAEMLSVTLVVHPSMSRDPRLQSIPRAFQYNFMREEALAVLLLEHSDVFQRFPELKILVCHCGGALQRLFRQEQRATGGQQIYESGEEPGGSVGLKVRREKEVVQDLSDNLFFDSCAYDPYFLMTAIRQRGPRRIVFGTEAPGAGSHLRNPLTGLPSDSLVPVIDSFDFLTRQDKQAIFSDNPKAVFPRLGMALVSGPGGPTSDP